jgi:hypothetical protein
MSWWKKALKVVGNVASAVVPVGGGVIKAVIDTAVGSGGGGTPTITVPKSQLTGGNMLPALTSAVQAGLPALTSAVGSKLPALAAAAGTAAIASQTVGTLPFWRGAGGKLQMPWNDPQVPEYLKQFALDDAYLKQCVRAPRGYVVVRDAQGRPFAVNRWIAQKFGVWRPSPKPMLTATDVRALRRAAALQKKLARLCKTYGPKVKRVNVCLPKPKRK